jgi:nucleoid-associated protein YgaU
LFFKGSRYERVESHSITDESGSVITYKKVRFISETHASMGHLVVQGDRLDNIAHRYYKDPERFWRICDANLAMWPDELLAEAGRIILIPPSEE